MQLVRKLLSCLGWIWYPVRRNAMFFIFMYALGVIVSFVTLPSYMKGKIYENTYFELFFDLYVIGFILWLLPRKIMPWVRGICYVIGYGLAIIDSFCFIKFSATINPSMLLLVNETTGSESREFFETYITWDLLSTDLGWVLLLLIVHILITLLWLLAKRKISKLKISICDGKVDEKPLRQWAKTCLDVALSALVVWALWAGWDDTMTNKEGQWKLLTRDTIADVEKTLNEKPHGEMYQPSYRLALAYYCNKLIDKQLGRIKDGIKDVSVDSCTAKSPHIVLIIGESYNRRHSQLYGYDKTTTPKQVELERTGRLTKFSDVTTPWNLTSYVFKHLMTTYCVGDDGDWCDYPLFCQLFRLAGYKVNFLTNQFIYHAKDAVFDASGGFFLNDKELSEAQFDIRNEETHLWDEDLLKDYDRLVAPAQQNSQQNQLTIFHLIGQHLSYRIRCPRSKHKFDPKDYDLPDNTEREKRNIAYYDCAVWYNDSVVGAIVDHFKDEEAIIVYLPDHGEEVYGPGSLHHCGRNHTTNISYTIASEEYAIPMWIYCTDRYSVAHPEVKNAVVEASRKRFMIDALSHMLLGLAGIECKYYNPQYDLLSPSYNEKRKRLMQHVVDYDEIMEKNSYLKR